MNNPICSECNSMPTHHKCKVCKVVPVCPECCDQRGIDDLNMITCVSCHHKEILSINWLCNDCGLPTACRECMQCSRVLLCVTCFEKKTGEGGKVYM